MADSARILSDIIEVISSEMNIDASTLGADTQLTELDVSSIEFLEMMFTVEEKVGASLDINTMEGIGTLGDLANIVVEQIGPDAEPQSA